MENSYDYVSAPHYRKFPIETIDLMVKIWGKDKVADFCEMNAFKYRMRLGHKPDSLDDDLKKEDWYLQKSKQLKQ